MCRSIACIAFAAMVGILQGQTSKELFEKAPPHIEEALRARITEFFQLHMDSKFRQAEALVAEDSKDAFYDGRKEAYKSFEIIRINYEENFTRAKAVVAVGMTVVFNPGAITKIPITTLWKVENGQWCWYTVPPSKSERMSPFGIMKPGPAAPGSTPFPKVPAAGELLNKVKLEKSEVRFTGSQPGSDSIVIANQMQGTVQLTILEMWVPGLTAELDKETLAAGEKAVLSLHWKPSKTAPDQPATVRVQVKTTSEILPVTVSFAPGK